MAVKVGHVEIIDVPEEYQRAAIASRLGEIVIDEFRASIIRRMFSQVSFARNQARGNGPRVPLVQSKAAEAEKQKARNANDGGDAHRTPPLTFELRNTDHARGEAIGRRGRRKRIMPEVRPIPIAPATHTVSTTRQSGVLRTARNVNGARQRTSGPRKLLKNQHARGPRQQRAET